MNRRAALWGASLLTVVAVLSIFFVVQRADAGPAAVTASDPAALTVDNANGSSAPLNDITYQQREAALQNQVAKGKEMLQSMDSTYQPQLAQLEDELSRLEKDVAQHKQNIAALQEQATNIQRTFAEQNQRYQQQVNEMQARDANAQQQLAITLSALQAAYAQINARKSGNAPAGGAHGGNQHDDGD